MSVKTLKQTLRLVGPGAVAGITGAGVMYALFLVARITVGIPTPSELFADTTAPYLPVPLFGVMISVVGGYTQLKILGFTGVVVGALIAGAVGGAVAQRRSHPTRLVWTYAAALFVLSIAGFWSVLQTNYLGATPGLARIATIALLAAGYALYATVTAMLIRPRTDPNASRQRFIATAIGAGAAVVGVGSWTSLFLRASFPYDGQTVKGPGVTAITPNERFYAVTKNVTDPSVELGLWRLTVGGAAEQPLAFDFAQLTALPSVLQQTTLMCINNDVDGGLMSNAEWRGVPLRSLIALAKPSVDVKRVAFHCADNYIETIPIAKAMEPTTLLAYTMNGEALPARHGFPIRVLVPGYFGERNPKWLVGITFETTDFRGFYERQGWGPNFIVPTHARFDVPDFTQPLSRGHVEIRGVAFAGNRGVSRVEVSTSGGASWSDAVLISAYHQTAWRLWKYDWDAPSGDHRLLVRATDSNGAVQVALKRPTAPQGATGLQEVLAHVA